MAIVGRGERGDGVDQEQSGMAGAVDRLADFADRGQAAGRGLVMEHAHRLDLVGLVFPQLRLDDRGVGTGAPVGRNEFRLEPELDRHVLPQGGELAGLDHQHAVAGRQGVDQGGFPGAGAGRGIDDDRVRGLEDGLDAFERAFGELGEFRPAVVDDRRVHGAQNAVRKRGRAGNLQEMTAGGAGGVLGHGYTSTSGAKSAVVPPLQPAGRRNWPPSRTNATASQVRLGPGYRQPSPAVLRPAALSLM